MKPKIKLRIRSAHRYLGVFLGIQFLFWTVSGLYFSWTNLDEIHGNQFKRSRIPMKFSNLLSPSKINYDGGINSIEIREISGNPYYWVNNEKLYNAYSGEVKEGINKQEALDIASKNMNEALRFKSIKKISKTGNHHEYREKLLPAYVIAYDSKENIKAYVSVADGKFQTVRHRDWRWFDFLWMTHTMDYEGRDDFNNKILRIFSLLGLITVFSGFLLYFVSSKTLQKIFKK